MRLFLSIVILGLTVFSMPAHAVLEDYPSIKLQGLDKSVGRTITFEAKVGSTIQYGPLYIKIHACRKAPPIETPESAAFLQIWEVPPGSDKSEWVFSGWMFASSPALSAMDHPVYDVWVLDCTGREEPNEEAAAAESSEEADQTTLPAGDGVQTEQQEIPTDSEAEPEPATETPVTTDPAPTAQQEQPATTIDESEIPMDGEAEQDTTTAPAAVAPVVDPNAPYNPSTYPAAPAPTPQYPNPEDAPYNPPQPQQAPAVPQGEGIYSPSQGRVVPAY